jgi:hypothetical protein
MVWYFKSLNICGVIFQKYTVCGCDISASMYLIVTFSISHLTIFNIKNITPSVKSNFKHHTKKNIR